jgi:hypothetical protein
MQRIIYFKNSRLVPFLLSFKRLELVLSGLQRSSRFGDIRKIRLNISTNKIDDVTIKIVRRAESDVKWWGRYALEQNAGKENTSVRDAREYDYVTLLPVKYFATICCLKLPDNVLNVA